MLNFSLLNKTKKVALVLLDDQEKTIGIAYLRNTQIRVMHVDDGFDGQRTQMDVECEVIELDDFRAKELIKLFQGSDSG